MMDVAIADISATMSWRSIFEYHNRGYCLPHECKHIIWHKLIEQIRVSKQCWRLFPNTLSMTSSWIPMTEHQHYHYDYNNLSHYLLQHVLTIRHNRVKSSSLDSISSYMIILNSRVVDMNTSWDINLKHISNDMQLHRNVHSQQQ